MSFQFNEQQLKICNKISKINKWKNNKLLILGGSGSGKTTVVTKSLSDTSMKPFDLKVCFCAFTNKATKVMKNMVSQHIRSFAGDNTNPFSPDFQTIHSLLKLEPNTIDLSQLKSGRKSIIDKLRKKMDKNIYKWDDLKHIMEDPCQDLDKENDDMLMFEYNFRKLTDLIKYDVLVIDECSTISKELYIYLESTIMWLKDVHTHSMKIIFTGDYYQLPPVNEDKSVVFNMAVKEKWPLFKLSKVMRSKTKQIDDVNRRFIKFIDEKVKKGKLNRKTIGAPYKVLPYDKKLYICEQPDFFRKYVELTTENKIIITYSNANCNKVNGIIQSLLDKKNKTIREPDPEYEHPYSKTPTMIWFNKGDRLSVQSSIIIPSYKCSDDAKETTAEQTTAEQTVTEQTVTEQKSIEQTEEYLVYQGDENNDKVYNGDLFMVESQKRVKLRTILNVLDKDYPSVPQTFNGQLLTVYNSVESDNEDKKYIQIFHVDTLELEKTRRLLRRRMKYKNYVDAMSLFKKNFSTLRRGYCVTCYKVQGSEFKYVFVNLKSFWACFSKNKKKRTLFSAFYTACTRSSERLFLYW